MIEECKGLGAMLHALAKSRDAGVRDRDSGKADNDSRTPQPLPLIAENGKPTENDACTELT